MLKWPVYVTMPRRRCAERPRIIEGPKDVTVQESSDVLFRCQSNADPDVTVIWKKQRGQIPPGRSASIDQNHK